MDLITQGILGAAVGHVVAGRKLGGAALGLGALGGLLPDADALFISTQSLDYWRYHRGVSHSLLVLPLVALPLAWVGHYWSERRRALSGSLDALTMTFAHWYLFWFAVLMTHPLLDAITHWGTMLFAPLDATRYGVSALPIIDIVYSLTLIIGIVVAFRSGIRTDKARFTMATALIASSAWIAYGHLENQRAVSLATADAKRQGIAADKVYAYTTLLTPWLRRVVASNGTHHVGFISTWNPQPIRWRTFTPAPDATALMDRVRKSEAGDIYWRFAKDVIFPERDGNKLKLYDMRYGTLGGTLKGFWGMEIPATIAAEGSPEAISKAARQFISRPSITGEQLATFIAATFGRPQSTY